MRETVGCHWRMGAFQVALSNWAMAMRIVRNLSGF